MPQVDILNFLSILLRHTVWQSVFHAGYCGHYALFFALEMLEACCTTSAKQICYYVARTANPGSFWKRYIIYNHKIINKNNLMIEDVHRYWMSTEELLKEASMQGSEEWWPWTSSHIHSGDMERSFLNHLLSTDPQVLAINTDNNIHVLHVRILVTLINGCNY